MATMFWMVWREHGGAPTVRHQTKRSARAEAERLAKQVGGTFYVLEAVGACQQTPPVMWSREFADDNESDDGIPF